MTRRNPSPEQVERCIDVVVAIEAILLRKKPRFVHVGGLSAKETLEIAVLLARATTPDTCEAGR